MNAGALRVGLIGLGRMGRHHARVLRTLDEVVLVGALDPHGDPYRAADGVPLAADVDALIRLGLDYAVVACPTLLHEPLGVALATAGIPTLIEKPLAGDPTAAIRLAEAFHTAGVPAAVGYIERFNPALIALRQRVQDGQLGDVFSVATSRTGPYPTRITDVGVIHDLATHDLDSTAWITSSHYTSITARTAHRSGRAQEDLLAAIGQLSDGTITQHQVNWLSPLKARTTTVIGDHGVLIADTLTSGLSYWANKGGGSPPEPHTTSRGVSEGDATRYVMPHGDPLTNEHLAFRDLLLGRSRLPAALDDGVHAVLTAHAALLASITGTTRAVQHQFETYSPVMPNRVGIGQERFVSRVVQVGPCDLSALPGSGEDEVAQPQIGPGKSGRDGRDGGDDEAVLGEGPEGDGVSLAGGDAGDDDVRAGADRGGVTAEVGPQSQGPPQGGPDWRSRTPPSSTCGSSPLRYTCAALG